MSVTIAVIDHGAGNLVSIAQGLRRAGAAVVVADRPEDLGEADGIVLPGVGATATVMDGIRSAGFEDVLRTTNRPLLGICVGMQVLFETSDEDGASCLELLPGRVRKLEDAPRLPHIGWNELTAVRPDPLLAGLAGDATVYFVHSFAPSTDPELVTATATYGGVFPAAVRSGRISGTQFHPERSGANGLTILANFVGECREAARAA